MRVLLAVAVFVLAGCGMMQPKSDLDLKETVKDKNGFVGCSSVIGAWGTVLTVVANLDQNTPTGKNATITINDGCKNIDLKTDSPPPRVVPTPQPQIGSPTPVPRISP